ncbi:hypothetical protein [Natrinema sp. CBA1119]|uniref:hypothetical protein n=1 Tax=Natrinema sp. CBA1119 TaxID=1608465 RepID=UPI00159B8B83|nr:hypothetical protein [Natrinema sp. CBA1119]
MSKANFVDSDNELEPETGVDALEENRELFERIADAGLSVSEHFQRALERAEEADDE